MRRSLFICVVVGVLLQAAGCSLNDDSPNFHFTPLQIVSAEVPDSFELNETNTITVTYLLPDGCTSFSGFDVSEVDTTVRNVVVFGIVRTDQDNCATLAQEAQETFDFTFLNEGPYTFRFWQGEGADGTQEFFEVVVPEN